MKKITRIRKIVVPWMEQFELALWLSDPKNKSKLKTMSFEKLGCFALKFGLYELMGKVMGATDEDGRLKVLLDELPRVAEVRREQLRKEYSSIVKKLSAIKL